MSIIDDLKYDHEAILFGLSLSRQKIEQKSLDFEPIFKKLCVLIEDIHHYAEEELLFRPLLDAAFFYHGGPRCTHFMSLKLVSNPFSGVERILNKTSEQFLSKENIFCPAHHPLSIPASEHHAAHELTTHIWRQWNNGGHTMHLFFGAYEALLKEHIEKEENCLFEMIKSNVTKDVLETMQIQNKSKHAMAKEIYSFFKTFL